MTGTPQGALATEERSLAGFAAAGVCPQAARAL